ncbi:MAG: UDP-N-acetylmuramoyl-tripeptide--D-alanyl-D-alanine ligase [Clostridiales bacterium]|nr:UDP-N-acetylmuramoyl-tripeptide--D-alanyl-D-alanine ligase [Clostridiales bacterium]
MTDGFLNWLLWLAPALAAVPAAKGLIHVFQLSSYQFRGYILTLKRRSRQEIIPGLILSTVSFLLCIGADYMARSFGKMWLLVGALLTGLCGLLLGKFFHKSSRSLKRLVYTARIQRLIASLGFVMIILAWLLRKALPVMGFSSILPLFSFLWLGLAALLVLPIEMLIKRIFMRDAMDTLANQEGLIRIGITGSYGKTSVKFFLDTLLKMRYSVLATRDSFNTPMGITRVIREDMQPAHRVFIAEVGARHRGDIKELCRLVNPQIGILTAIGPQHLETFKSIERVRDTKYDLISRLPADGYAVFYNDGGLLKELYDKTHINKAIVGRPGDDLWAEDVISGYEGSSFNLCFKDGTRLRCTTDLIGEHNINNILLSAIVARYLGLSDMQIKRGISSLQSVTARLKPQKQADGSIVINNGFNANPHSSRASLKMLSTFPGRKIVVTPGYIELGSKEHSFHLEFGEHLAQVADMVLLIGPRRTRPIHEGLVSKGFDEENILAFKSLKEAQAYLGGILASGDVVLYENDLPDQYSEG